MAASIQAAQAAAAAQMAPPPAVQEEHAAQSLQPPPPPPPAAPAADGACVMLETAAQMAPQERWASISAAGGTVAGLARTGRIAPAIKDALKKKAASRSQRAIKKSQEEDELLETLEAASNATMPVDLDSEAELAETASAPGASTGADGSGLQPSGGPRARLSRTGAAAAVAVQDRHPERQRLEQFQRPPQRRAAHWRTSERLRGPPPGDQVARRRRLAGRHDVLQAAGMASRLQPRARDGDREGVGRRRDPRTRPRQPGPHSRRQRVRRPGTQGCGGPTLRSWSRHPRPGFSVHGGRQRT